jgi:butyrate kinase
MSNDFYILTINPGSTSTKIGIFKNDELKFKQNIYNNDHEIASFERVWDQYAYRKKEILNFIREKQFNTGKLSCVVGRGGLFKPIISGTYAINKKMLNDARAFVQGEHASNLGCVLSFGIAWDYNISSFIVDPPCVDEMEEVARLSGHVDIKRRSLVHALNIKAMARAAADMLKKPLTDINLIVIHLGGGISVTPLKKGRMIDTSNALSAGPFSTERTGELPMIDFLEYVFKKKWEVKEAKKMLVGQGGMFSYLGTKSMVEASERYENGDPKAQLVIKSMAYQVAKEIGAMAVPLKGDMDAIVLTGGAAHSDILVKLIKEQISFLGEILVLPGEDELKALAQGGLRVLRGEEEALSYPQQIEFEELFDGNI